MDKKQWKDGIKEAKQVARLLRLTNKHRVKLAEIAVKITDIQIGGRSSKSRFSIVRFGAEIGINPNTVYEWIRQYNLLYLKLTDKQKSEYLEVSANMIKPVMKGLTKKTRKATVQKKFKAIAKAGFVESKFRKYLAVLNTIIFHTQTLSKISEIPDQYLTEFRIKARQIDKAMTKEINARSGGGKRKIKPQKEMTPDEIWLEAGIDISE
jgi:transposase-like protein